MREGRQPETENRERVVRIAERGTLPLADKWASGRRKTWRAGEKMRNASVDFRMYGMYL